ncbi:hypothetical protein [Streptomyces sp. HUAS TT20]|uniref:hypothetical protein n=1 Tax=Streptomyces sp. HUAS TT20 TaxID=3447509 RepID=UPI0021DB22A0|nr:hypothetical protein [Streptomyces sp. HUAS 15-9]UXY30794.1 hypothetical protein N8I87_32390 [Streptomyces sp. HUAS 15-9]
MSRMTLPPEEDQQSVSALYLSRLDHESLYSDAELLRAIAETVERVGGRQRLADRYAETLREEAAAGGDRRGERHKWALRMARELARDPAGADHRLVHRAVGGPGSEPPRGTS